MVESVKLKVGGEKTSGNDLRSAEWIEIRLASHLSI